MYLSELMGLGRRRTVADHLVVKDPSQQPIVRYARRYVQTDQPRK